MPTTTEQTWLTYLEAAKRVKASDRTIKRWRREGMVMRWTIREGQKVRVVELEVLLAFWRVKMANNLPHQYRLRRKRIERGETPAPITRPQRRSVTPQRSTPTESAGDAVVHTESPSEASQAALQDVFAELPPLKGADEYAQLQKALSNTTPACDGLDEFTADRFDDPSQVQLMRDVCASCDVLEQCRAFAARSKPTGGFWAGQTAAEIKRLRAA